MYLKIKVKDGIYRVRIPTGRAGALHFAILTKYMDGSQGEVTLADKAALDAGERPEAKPMTPEMKSNIAEAFLEWSSRVLGLIIVGFTPNGNETENQIKVDDISGQDQYAIFMALLGELEVSEDFFRIVE